MENLGFYDVYCVATGVTVAEGFTAADFERDSSRYLYDEEKGWSGWPNDWHILYKGTCMKERRIDEDEYDQYTLIYDGVEYKLRPSGEEVINKIDCEVPWFGQNCFIGDWNRECFHEALIHHMNEAIESFNTGNEPVSHPYYCEPKYFYDNSEQSLYILTSWEELKSKIAPEYSLCRLRQNIYAVKDNHSISSAFGEGLSAEICLKPEPWHANIATS